MQHELKHALAGLAAVTGAAADAKRAKALPEEAKAKLKELQKNLSATRKKTLEEMAAARAKAMDDFFAQYPQAAKMKGLPVSAIRRVVSSFIINDADAAEGIESTGGNQLLVRGQVVAERPAAFSKFMKVCPGEFGSDKVSRRTANELLSMMSAGLRVHDRDGKAFLDPAGARGRVVSGSSCYNVEVTAAIRKAANKNVAQAIAEIGQPVQFTSPSGDTAEFRRFKQEEADFKAMAADFKRLGDARKAKEAAAAAKKAARSAAAVKAAATRAAKKASKKKGGKKRRR